jgi:hypothetical protein
MVEVAEQERNVEHLQFGREVCDDRGADHSHVDRADLHAFDDLAIPAERATALEPDGDTAAGPLQNLFGELAHSDRLGRLRPTDIAEVEGHLRFCQSQAARQAGSQHAGYEKGTSVHCILPIVNVTSRAIPAPNGL